MKITFWLTRDSYNKNYWLWKEMPIWDNGEWKSLEGDSSLRSFCPSDITRFFHINWKGGKRSIRKLTVSF